LAGLPLARTLASLLLALSPGSTAKPAAPPPAHPFLLLNKASLPALKAKLAKPPFAARWANLLATADSFCKAPVAGFEKVRDAQGICGATAFAYAVTGKPEYAKRARDEALALLAAPAWHQPKDWNKGAELPTAEASQACALVYDWCFDTLTIAERATFRDAILAKSTRIYLESIEKHHDMWVENPGNNWSGVVHGGCGLAALALSSEGAEFQRAAALARTHVNDFLKGNRLEDGEGLEGAMYARYGLLFAELFHAADLGIAGAGAAAGAKADAGVADDSNAKLAGYWDVYLHGPDQRYANFNDMGEETFEGLHGDDPRHPEGGPSGELCALYESRVAGGDPLLLWAADQGGAPFFYEGNSPFWFLWRRDAPPAGKRPELQPAVLFRGAGDAVFRSPELWLALHAGFTSERGHEQRDLGTFVLVANGERFVCDPGYGVAATADHSTLVVDGKDQPVNVRAKWLRFGSAKSFQYGAVDLTEAGAPALRRWIRHVVVVRGSWVALFDDVAGDGEVAWRLQTRLKVERGSDGVSARIAGAKGSLTVVAAAPADVELTTGAGATTWLQGRRKSRSGATTFVTVLLPVGGTAKAAGAAPRVRWDGNVLTVGADSLRFKPGEGLSSVNDEPTTKIASAKERSLVPFRK
jgi:hypothetical protein